MLVISQNGPQKALKTPSNLSIQVSDNKTQHCRVFINFQKLTLFIGFTEDEEVTDAYKAIAEPVIKENISYGASRLAQLIIDIYGDNVESPEMFLQ